VLDIVRILQVFPSREGVLSPDPDFLQEDIPRMSANRNKERFFTITELVTGYSLKLVLY
jgi:hypothetical protein